MLNVLRINSFSNYLFDKKKKNIWKLCHWLIGYLLYTRRVLRLNGFDERLMMSRGRPQWGATFSIHKVERRDDENSEETGADPESTDPVCTSISRLCSPAVFVPFVLNVVYVNEKVSW